MRTTLARQDALRAELESDPTSFFEDRYPVHLAETRARIAALVGADPAGLVFVSNASMGVATVLNAIASALREGDELLTTDHVYPACRNAMRALAAQRGASVIQAHVPFPLRDASEVERAVMERVNPRTRLVLLDHVTSPTGLVFPIEPIVKALEARGIPVLVDGAHAPGMVPLDLASLGASYYTGNLHKWLSAPKSSALLYVREDRRRDFHPLVISHGFGKGLHEEFDWTGTFDATALFSAPAAIDGLATLHEEGLPGLMRTCRERALRAQRTLSEALGIEVPAPASMIGTLVSVPLPLRSLEAAAKVKGGAGNDDPDRLALEHALRTRVPLFPWPDATGRLLRISLAPYVSDDDVEEVAAFCRARFR